MDLSQAFGAVNRTILWGALYKKVLPIKTILNIRRRRNKTTLQAKRKKQYGKIHNEIGSPQGSAISALLFIIYLKDMMGDYRAINYLDHIPYRTSIQRND